MNVSCWVNESRELRYERDSAGYVINIIPGRTETELVYNSPNVSFVLQIPNSNMNQRYQEFIKARHQNQEELAEMILLEMFFDDLS